MRVGWIGLGAMGLGMARCAARAGHQVTGHTRGRAAHQALADDGGRLSESLDEVARDADVLCVNLFNDDQVRSVLYGDGVLAKLKPGALLVIHTTGDPALSRRLQADAPSIEVVDGAFSGSPQQAAAGELTLMAGGEDRAWARAEPLFAAYAEFRRHVGPLGAGMQLKLINNLLFAAQIRLAADTYRMAADAGFSAQAVSEVLSRCSGASRALAILGRDGRAADNLAGMRIYVEKDVETALRIAEAAGVDCGAVGEVARRFSGSASTN